MEEERKGERERKWSMAERRGKMKNCRGRKEEINEVKESKGKLLHEKT